MNIIPKPKRVEIQDGFLKNKMIRLDSVFEDERLSDALSIFCISDEGVPLKIFIGQDNECEAYDIKIERDNIVINANGSRGAFYAIQTLKQIFTHDEIACCYIEDAPDIKHRGFYHDVTRGKVPTVETLKKLIDNMAYYKLNSLQLYVEHTFEFKEFADSKEKTGYLTAKELRELDNYCKKNFIDFIPSLATFGHLYELLQKEKFSHLREMDEFENKIFWENRMVHHTIDPTKDESFELIKSLIDQYIVNFSSDRFNICCDETFDLKSGKHKDEDTGKLYIEFVNKIIEYVKSKGKTVMMWADILLNHSKQIDKLPENVELLNWWYWANPDENTFKVIKDSKRPQFVCPGTGSWSRFCENYEMNIINIIKMIDYGYQYGAEGVINTNWGDWGNPCSIELAMFGLVLGAAKSWNVSTVVDDKYISAVNNLLYKKEGASEYIKRLSSLCNKISWYTLAECYANIILSNKPYNEIEFASEKDVSDAINESFAIINEIKDEPWQEENYKEQIIVSAEGIAVMAEITALHAGYSLNRKTDTQKWLERYREKWLQDNKESELGEIEKMFSVLDTQSVLEHKNICKEI